MIIDTAKYQYKASGYEININKFQFKQLHVQCYLRDLNIVYRYFMRLKQTNIYVLCIYVKINVLIISKKMAFGY